MIDNGDCEICVSSGKYQQVISATSWWKHRTKVCLHDSCTDPPISSHSIGKETFLRQLSDLGHVMALVATREGHDIQSVGIKQASAFSGFCAKHDSSLFAEIDLIQKTLSANHIFSLHYRATCFSIAYTDAYLYRGRKLLELSLCMNCRNGIEFESSLIHGTRSTLIKEVSRLSKSEPSPQVLGSCHDLDSANFSVAYTTIIGAATRFLPFACPGDVAISLNVFPNEGSTRVVICAPTSDLGKNVIASIDGLDDTSLKKFVSNLAVSYGHNLVFSQNIESKLREELVRSFGIRRTNTDIEVDLWNYA